MDLGLNVDSKSWLYHRRVSSGAQVTQAPLPRYPSVCFKVLYLSRLLVCGSHLEENSLCLQGRVHHLRLSSVKNPTGKDYKTWYILGNSLSMRGLSYCMCTGSSLLLCQSGSETICITFPSVYTSSHAYGWLAVNLSHIKYSTTHTHTQTRLLPASCVLWVSETSICGAKGTTREALSIKGALQT